MNDRNHDRAVGSTAISFSCSVEMREQLLKLAKADRRTLSNYLQIVIEQHLKRARSSAVRAENS